MGEFTEADRVIVNDLYERMKKDEGVQKAAQTDDRQVYHRSVFPGIFDETAMAAYMENQEAYIQLFQDAKKYHAIAYLYEHRESANHNSLMLTLRSLLFGVREVKF